MNKRKLVSLQKAISDFISDNESIVIGACLEPIRTSEEEVKNETEPISDTSQLGRYRQGWNRLLSQLL
ncbi:hypothetical protein JIR001_03810 [Polycladomyces abyssicola]|uniref:Uncharacterized protein n=1 Tax=Polycladomyces abyssicola TaxID=1125966 RepID=A0A8D5ZMS6_9BACL|nr:hypothetical protein JIR001_03810 [Polycladomyces abyssicola]